MAKKPLRTWALIKRIQYAFGFFAFWSLVSVAVYFINFYQPNNCFDLTQNGEETGIDCGGDCVRICAADTIPPIVVWADSFEVVEGQYNTVAYIENKNQIAGVPELEYLFQLLNNGSVIAERAGKVILPPNSVLPVFEGKIKTDDGQKVTDTRLIIKNADLWIPATVKRNQFRSLDIDLSGADTRPRLNVEIENTELTSAEDVEVVATIFNERGEAVTASQTFIERIAARSTDNIVFTWPNSIAKTVHSCVIPTDVMLAIDLSGSMNNDGGDPAQPITDALLAAGQFANSLQDDDQISVVTFATEASLVTKLNSQHGAVAGSIVRLEIEPAEEVGYTNTASALSLSQMELDSERHNGDARKVLVVLTDGLPTSSGDEDVVAQAIDAAAKVRAGGVEVYAIGLGVNVDSEFVRQIASDEDNIYFAPTGSDLNKIYTEITASLCESGPTKIDVVAKTITTFAPLQ